ncbi:MAG: GWxTD domain-containing protein [Bacteroidota bacterium]
MQKFVRITLLLLLAFLLVLCQSKKRQYTTKPTKSLVNPDSDLLEVNAVAYHLSDSVTETYLEIKNENLIYKRPDTTLSFYAELKISYKLLAEPNARRILDSGSYYLLDRAPDKVEVKSIISKFNLKARIGNNYYLEVEVLDLNKKTKYAKNLNIYKQNFFSEQNFLLTMGGEVSFKNSFLKGDVVVVKSSNTSVSQVTVDCFFKEFGPALPPFSSKAPDEFKYKPDSVFVLTLTSSQYALTMPDKGFYHVRTDLNSFEGITIYTYDKTFPGVSNSDEMINCTRYIMSRTEFEECKDAPEKKAAIDKFWLTVGGSNERARELLKRYYGRVKEANKYFSSYTQGWKNDRGMIFIIYGHPTNNYRGAKEEIWVYGNEGSPSAQRFIFKKTQNPFSDNDYILERSQFYKEGWYTAVDYWRQGHVYLDGTK